MIVVGVDAHKKIHVASGHGRSRPADRPMEWAKPPCGWENLSRWAAALPAPQVWGIEGAWRYGRGLAQQLVAAGATVYEVNSRWTALGRRHARQRDESDRHDARARGRPAERPAARSCATSLRAVWRLLQECTPTTIDVRMSKAA